MVVTATGATARGCRRPRTAARTWSATAVDVTDQVHETRACTNRACATRSPASFNRRQLEVFEAGHREDGWAAISIDLDHFKQVNDSQGHDRGDQVLIEFCRFLGRRIGAGDAVVRLGGDEFALLLAGADARAWRTWSSACARTPAWRPAVSRSARPLREGDEALTATLARADGEMYSVRAATRGHCRPERLLGLDPA
jgi:diguanylate cyclase (GGDEF)-like protein